MRAKAVTNETKAPPDAAKNAGGAFSCSKCRFRLADMTADGGFPVQTVTVADLHEGLDVMLPVQPVQRVQNGRAVHHHGLKVVIDAAAVFPGEIGVDGAQTLIPHDALYHHLAEDPLHGGTLVLVIAVVINAVPYVEPQVVDDLVKGDAQRAPVTVQMEHVKVPLL